MAPTSAGFFSCHGSRDESSVVLDERITVQNHLDTSGTITTI
ncbi:hypothetical protein [Nakamurella antarctica]|nr:hypothetical protein [Nakamurella antarctica]